MQRNNDYRKTYQNYQQRLYQSKKTKETETRLFENMLEEQKRRLNSVFNNNDEQCSSLANHTAAMISKNMTNTCQSGSGNQVSALSLEECTKNCSNSHKSCASSGPEEFYRIISQITNKSKPNQTTNEMSNRSITSPVDISQNTKTTTKSALKVTSNDNVKVNQNDQVMKRKNEVNTNNNVRISIRAGKSNGIEPGKRFISSNSNTNNNNNHHHKKN